MIKFIKNVGKAAVALILSVNLFIFGYLAWPSPEYGLPVSGAPVIVEILRDAAQEGSIYALDDRAPLVGVIRGVTEFLYGKEITHGKLPPISPSDFKKYVVTGDLATTVSDLCSCGGLTDPISGVMLILDIPSQDWISVVSHETVHTFQAADGRLFKFSRAKMEYEAEVISRWVAGYVHAITLPAIIPVKQLSTQEKISAYKDIAQLGVFIKHKSR